ncbi:NAD(P)-dependent dehydrogenase (short-subunit alcohol dehydrogenase family) [Paraburkholderia sp. GAS448]
MMNRHNPVWLITGCSTGFGRELANLVLERGWRAVVTARDPSKVADIAEGRAARLSGKRRIDGGQVTVEPGSRKRGPHAFEFAS